MRNTKLSKSSMNVFTLFTSLLILVTLAACESTEGTSSESMENENESKQMINKDEEFAQLEEEFDSHVGVYAIDTGTNKTVEYQPNKRFAYSSTFKVLAAAVILKQNDLADLEEVVTYTEDDLVANSPVTEEHLDTGMTLLEISEAAIRKSDNTAGNIMLEAIGGPDQFKQSLRDMGDEVTEPKRYETELNMFTPGEKQDTSTPKAMATSLKKVVLSDYLSEEKRELLINWMKGNSAGDTLIRAGAPDDWIVGDKSGAGTYGTRNDIAVVWPPNRDPIVIAVMSHRDTEDAKYDDELVAKAAEIALNALK